MGHENKCANLHGHNAVVYVYVKPIKDLDAIGRVIDFSIIKELVGEWIEIHWDHTMIVFKDDINTVELLKQAPGNKPIFLLDSNPTAENLAYYLLHCVCPAVFNNRGVIAYKIIFWETENCFVEVSL